MKQQLFRVWMLALVLLAGGAAEAQHTVRVTLAAHNVENFFDIFDDPYTPDEKARIKSNKSIEALGRLHRAINADYLGVCELENEGVLAYYRQKHLGDMGYDYLWSNYLRGTRGINLGFLSRVPLGPIQVWKFQRLRLPGSGEEWTFARDLVCVQIQPAADVKIDIFQVHLKSRLDAPGDPKGEKHRLAESMRLHQIAAEKLRADPNALYVAMGDFNDTPGASGITAVLADGVFVDPHAALPADQRISYLKEPYRSNIDYILVSPALARRVVPGSAKLVAGDGEGSDHAAVVLQLDLPTKDADAKKHWPYPLEKHDATLFMRPTSTKKAK